MLFKRWNVVVLLIAFGLAEAYDNITVELPSREHRGTWIATVYNIDWPLSPTSSVTTQQDQLKYLIAQISRAGLNAVYFQVMIKMKKIEKKTKFKFASESKSVRFDLLVTLFINRASSHGVDT